MKKRDTATSSVVAFLLILVILTAAAALWMAVVLPGELREAEEAEAKAALNALQDAAFLLEAQPFAEGSSLSLALPAGTLQTKNCGVLILDDAHQIPLQGLTFSTSGQTSFGILAGGIWRKDDGYAAWQILPQISCTKQNITLKLPVFSGDAACGSSEPVPVTFSFSESETRTISGTELSITIVSPDEWMLRLWETLFAETAYTYQDMLNTEVRREHGAVTFSATAKSGESLSLSAEVSRYAVSAGGEL